ncbi:NAD(P)H-hydrate dehydratase [Porticoccaceae bacterium]|nr:NAD(P)H-hydrate dehydratase [Porticoccaceae bacterium]
MSHKLIQDALFNAKSVRELDRLAIEDEGIAGIVLMKRAGRAVLQELLELYGAPSLLSVFCGGGNNGGDGYILAALAAEKHIPVQVFELSEELSGDAAIARQYAEQAKVMCTAFDSSLDIVEGVIVDSLLGTGYSGQLRPAYAEAIQIINDSGLPVVAVDIPSGLQADNGAVAELSVQADITITFIGAKPGLFSGRGPSVCGEVMYHSLDVPEAIFDQVAPDAELLDLAELLDYFPQLDVDAHKTQRGHTMVVGGDRGFGGAAIMAAETSARLGSGMTSLATRPEHIDAMLVRQPEVMACGVVSGQDLEPLLERPNVLVVGPGLGRSSWSEQLLQKAVAAQLPMVLDADGLNILAEGRVVPNPDGRQWVLTPHCGEAARLLNVTVAEIEADRFAAVRQLQKKYAAVVLLKGPGTLIAGPEEIIKVCPYGNPAMATAGMGDILSGVIGALIAQGFDLQTAAELGCCLHSSAADMAAEELGSRGLVATDILPYLHRLLNQEYL